MLKNAYLLVKIGADTAENEQHLAERLPTFLDVARGGPRFPPLARRRSAPRQAEGRRD